MDTTLIVSIVIAVVAIVPGVWALVNQANKDKTQARLDMNAAAQSAAMNIIGPLQAEVTRLQARVLELEKALIEKTTEIGDLMQSNIDKDSELRTMRYQQKEMQERLLSFESKKKMKSKIEGEESDSFKLEEELKANEAKKEEIKTYTLKTIESLSNGSLTNQTITETEE
jgi:hypothetical protein